MDSHLTSMLVDPPIGVICGVKTNNIWILEERCQRLSASYKSSSMLLTLKLSLSQCHIVTEKKIKPKKSKLQTLQQLFPTTCYKVVSQGSIVVIVVVIMHLLIPHYPSKIVPKKANYNNQPLKQWLCVNVP